ncbi:DUF5937 family protein [Actinosynnema sp. NPDC047251]|uniref:ArsR/SmtB family transcription factor n=1 Tax=Saccharothrix espanaensis TaxID=103731 RepID=UPI00030630C6|nr:DUF5937 family protein [Saccharothrix espanaensis]
MAVRIRLTGAGPAGAGLAKVRFAYSPVFETVMAVDGLRVPGAHAVHLPWVAWARERLAAIDDLPVLLDLMAGPVKPAALMPVPDVRMPDLEAELVGLPARVADVVRSCHEVLVAPHWRRIVAVLEADVHARAAVLADRGIGAVFADLHPGVAWADGELVLYGDSRPDRPHRVDLARDGLVLSPSVFCWPRAWTAADPVGPGVVRYPARGIATLWESEPAAPDELAALIGKTRAALLVLLAAPMSTTELATRLGVTAGAVSQHIGVLRGARLVSTRRDGRAVLHMRTARADALLA